MAKGMRIWAMPGEAEMSMRFEDLCQNPRVFRSATGLTVEEFKKLLRELKPFFRGPRGCAVVSSGPAAGVRGWPSLGTGLLRRGATDAGLAPSVPRRCHSGTLLRHFGVQRAPDIGPIPSGAGGCWPSNLPLAGSETGPDTARDSGGVPRTGGVSAQLPDGVGAWGDLAYQ